MSRKKIAIIGIVGVPACYGGFETLAEHLLENAADEDEYTVYCSSKEYSKNERLSYYKGARLKYLPFRANGVQSIIYDSVAILHALFFADVILVLGVSGAWLFPLIKLFTSLKIVVSIDGIEWKRDKWSPLAKLYLKWAEGIAVKYSHIDISDNESIQDYTAKRYASLSQIIEYGADHTLRVKPNTQDKRTYPFLQNTFAFKVCRIEPENNVHIILEAFNEMPRYKLVIVGNWDKSEYGIELKEKYQNVHNINLLDPIYNQRDLDLLRSNATIYIHGHSAGGTNPSLVEAMFLGLPIVACGVCYNRTTTGNKALYFSGKRELINIISQTKITAWKKIGKAMKEIADNRYTWKITAKKYNYLFRKALQITNKGRVNLPFKKSEILLKNQASHLQYGLNFYE